MKGHHHPGNQIWKNDDRTNCKLWDITTKPCDWNGGELGATHPGATMIWCSGSTSTGNNGNYNTDDT